MTPEQLADDLEGLYSRTLTAQRAAAELRLLAAENAALTKHLKFVERWANHHATKPHMTAQEALSVIQHYPPIKAITNGYADGKVPYTHDPYAENAALREMLRKCASVLVDSRHGEPCNRKEVRDLSAAIDAAMQKETP